MPLEKFTLKNHCDYHETYEASSFNGFNYRVAILWTYEHWPPCLSLLHDNCQSEENNTYTTWLQSILEVVRVVAGSS